MEFRPLHDRVVIQADEAEAISKGGIHLPDIAKEKPQRGIVIAVGKGKTENGLLVIPTVQKDDKILYSKYSGVEVTIKDKEYLVVHESDILVILFDKSS